MIYFEKNDDLNIYNLNLPKMQKIVKAKIIFCFVAERFSFLVLKYPGHKYKIKMIKDTKLAISKNKGNPSVGIKPIKFERIDSPKRTGRADSEKDIKKFEDAA